MELNARAWRRCERLLEQAAELRVAVAADDSGARVVDCGVKAAGGLAAGLALAEVCLAGLGRAELEPCDAALGPWPRVTVATDHPLAACLGAQYAGWRLKGEKFFAMGSGPMRAAGSKEPLLDELGLRERADCAVGVLEAARLPPPDVCRQIAAACGLPAERVLLLAAPTASLAGTVQVVARTVETALHKLHELHFDVRCVQSGFGLAPLPPVAADDLTGIGRTNDAVLYGGEVTLWVRGEDAAIEAVGPRTPSGASADFGRPFAELFARAGGDFYALDPLLFSPAVVQFVNLATGRTFRYGELRPDVLAASFG